MKNLQTTRLRDVKIAAVLSLGFVALVIFFVWMIVEVANSSEPLAETKPGGSYDISIYEELLVFVWPLYTGAFITSFVKDNFGRVVSYLFFA